MKNNVDLISVNIFCLFKAKFNFLILTEYMLCIFFTGYLQIMYTGVKMWVKKNYSFAKNQYHNLYFKIANFL